jgi:hypothetical protein
MLPQTPRRLVTPCAPSGGRFLPPASLPLLTFVVGFASPAACRVSRTNACCR